MIIYIDGACSHNGNYRGTARGGIGVFFKVDDQRNVSRMIDDITTNNQAELSAAITALEYCIVCSRDLSPQEVVELRSDSEYLVKGMTEWIDNWKQRGWQTSQRTPVLNVDLWKSLYQFQMILNKRGHRVVWTHVSGHTGQKDGNYYADLLATNAIK